MPTITADEMAKVLKDAGLDGAGNGVIFPWGVKIVEIEGKKMLQPLTPAEYKAAVKEGSGKDLSDDEVRNPWCQYTTNRCAPHNCSGPGRYCTMEYSSGGWYCVCNY